MTFWEAVLLGIIQGIFMFFPVSSTSHLVVVQHWLIARGSALPPPESPEMILFDLVVHVGTLVSIAVVFGPSLGAFLRRVGEDLRVWRQAGQGGARRPKPGLYLRLAGLGLLSVAVTGAVGLPLKALFETAFAHPLVLSVTLTLTGFVLWWTDVLPPRRRGLREVTPGVAVVVGLAQGLALLPGLSRSGMTIAFALFTGLKRRWAAEYSFFIAFPTIIAAAVVQSGLVLYQQGPAVIDPAVLTTGFVVAALVGVAALKLVLHLLYRARFRYFSYYVWLLAGLIAAGAHQGLL